MLWRKGTLHKKLLWSSKEVLLGHAFFDSNKEPKVLLKFALKSTW